jgi:hypothetical protein
MTSNQPKKEEKESPVHKFAAPTSVVATAVTHVELTGLLAALSKINEVFIKSISYKGIDIIKIRTTYITNLSKIAKLCAVVALRGTKLAKIKSSMNAEARELFHDVLVSRSAAGTSGLTLGRLSVAFPDVMAATLARLASMGVDWPMRREVTKLSQGRGIPDGYEPYLFLGSLAIRKDPKFARFYEDYIEVVMKTVYKAAGNADRQKVYREIALSSVMFKGCIFYWEANQKDFTDETYEVIKAIEGIKPKHLPRRPIIPTKAERAEKEKLRRAKAEKDKMLKDSKSGNNETGN